MPPEPCLSNCLSNCHTHKKKKRTFWRRRRNHGRRRRSGGLGAVTPSRCVCAHARPRDPPSTLARCPAPQPSPTPHPQHCTRTRTASASAPSCTATSPARGMVRVLNPRCPNCLTNGACTLSQEHLHVNNCRKRNICPRVSACVLACFRVHNRSPDGQELSSVTPSSRVRSHRRRRTTNSTASETLAALRRPGAHVLVLCLPFVWVQGIGTRPTNRHAGAHGQLWC
jgi:hypothetical protein